jgi:hypothetical protein
VAIPKISPKDFRDLAPETQREGTRQFLKTLAPQTKTLASIRVAARKNGKCKLTLREINREIHAYRREPQP